MKKILLSIIVVISSCFLITNSAFALNSTRSAFLEAREVMKSQRLGREEFFKNAVACHQRGNIFCTFMVGDYYGRMHNYKKAYPYIVQFQRAKIIYHPDYAQFYDFMYFDLGLMYSLGEGVNKDCNRAIYYMEKSARLHNAMAALYLASFYHTNMKNLYDGGVRNHALLMSGCNAYAWYKLGLAINNKKHEFDSQKPVAGKITSPLQGFYDLKHDLNFALPHGWLSQAEKRYRELANTL